MFLFLSKLIPLIFYPVGLAGILLAAGLVFHKKERFFRAVVLAAFLVIWLGGNSWVSSALVKPLEWRYLPPPDYPQADAIVILGGGTLPQIDPRPTVEVNDAGDRVLFGARLFQAGKAPIVLLSGGNLPWSTEPSSPAEDMAAILEWAGIADNAILVENKSTNTSENALFARQILEPRGVQRILLVTSALHMPRSVLLFEAQGFEVIPAPVDFMVTRSTASRSTFAEVFLALFPSSKNIHRTTLAMKEYIGIIVIKLGG